WSETSTRPGTVSRLPCPLSIQLQAGLLRWLRGGELVRTHKESSGVLGRPGLIFFESSLEL
ncbi:unnamed protein product, partial [Rangifer tarandus platyrhynchus]